MLRGAKVVDDSSAAAVSPGGISRAARLILPGTVQRLGEGSPVLPWDLDVCPVRIFIDASWASTVWVKAEAAGRVVLAVAAGRLCLALAGRYLW